MKYALLIVGCLLWFGSGVAFINSSTVMQQILAGLFGVSGTVMVCTGAVIYAIKALPAGREA